MGGACCAVDVPAWEGVGCGGIDFDEGDGAGVEVDTDAGEIIGVFGPDVLTELGEEADGAGGEHKTPDLVEEVGAPIEEPPAAEGGFGAPMRAVFFCGGAYATGPLAQAGFYVDDFSEDAGLDGLRDSEIVGVPAAIVEDA